MGKIADVMGVCKHVSYLKRWPKCNEIHRMDIDKNAWGGIISVINLYEDIRTMKE